MRIALILFLTGSIQLHSQNVSFLTELDDSTLLITQESELVSKLIFYVSDVQLETKSGEILNVVDYHLIDFNDPNSLILKDLKTQNREIKKIHFKFGIDSITNVSGAFGGALDPTNGMYWSWQNGYINFKIEGSMNDEKYILHIGGYSAPNKTVQQVELTVLNPLSDIEVVLPLDILFQEIIPEDNTVMSPSTEAVSIAKRIASSFYLR